MGQLQYMYIKSKKSPLVLLRFDRARGDSYCRSLNAYDIIYSIMLGILYNLHAYSITDRKGLYKGITGRTANMINL